jgi:ABC-type phosphate transport system auxiliary subunit
MVDFQGRSVDAIRVRVPPRKPAAATRAIVTSGNRQLQASIADDPRQAMQAPLDEEVPF